MKKDQVQQQKEIQKIKQINETYRSQLNNWESKHQAYMDKANLNEEMLRNTINNLQFEIKEKMLKIERQDKFKVV